MPDLEMRTPIRLIIADDHVLFRQGLRSLLRLHNEIELVGEIETVRELRAVVAETSCDILLLDLQMERSSMDDIAELSRLTKVIVLTGATRGLGLAMALEVPAAVFRRMVSDQVFHVTPDLNVLAYTIAVAILSCLAFGLAPALRGSPG